jgi:hypothetical protein
VGRGRRGEQGHDAGLREARVMRETSECEWEGEGCKGNMRGWRRKGREGSERV